MRAIVFIELESLRGGGPPAIVIAWQWKRNR